MSQNLRGVRILFVLPSLGLGGAERQAFLFARHLLQEERADVRLLGFRRFDTLAKRCDAIGLAHEFFDFHHGYRSRVGHFSDAFRFTSLLRRRRTQILLPYCMFQNILCGLTWRAGGARLCIWNQRDEGRSRMGPWLERTAVGQMSGFISNSTHGATFLTDTLGVPPASVRVIHNGVEIPSSADANEDGRMTLDLRPEAFTACMVANIHSMKDHETLITAWRTVVDRLQEAGRPAHLLLAGAFADSHPRVVQQIEVLGLTEHVHLLGEVRHVAGLLAHVDLVVFSSFAEGIPNSVLEAMAAGLAVVGTDYPGIREAVGPVGEPWLAEPRNASLLAEKIVLAARDPGLRARLGEAGRRRIEEHFSVERMARAMTDVITRAWQDHG